MDNSSEAEQLEEDSDADACGEEPSPEPSSAPDVITSLTSVPVPPPEEDQLQTQTASVTPATKGTVKKRKIRKVKVITLAKRADMEGEENRTGASMNQQMERKTTRSSNYTAHKSSMEDPQSERTSLLSSPWSLHKVKSEADGNRSSEAITPCIVKTASSDSNLQGETAMNVLNNYPEIRAYTTIKTTKLSESLQDLFQGKNPPPVDLVEALLKQGADPNARFFQFKVTGIEFKEGCSLQAAVMHNDMSLVKTLIEHRANIHTSDYTKEAGVSKIPWTGNATFAVFPSDQVEILKFFVESCGVGVNLGSTINGEKGATLLWNSAYFGAEQCVAYLLSMQADLEETTPFQDNPLLKFTPLHIASRAGWHNVCRIFLEAKADIRGRCQIDAGQIPNGKLRGSWFFTPLDEAIEQSHLYVVKVLLEYKADLIFNENDTHEELVPRTATQTFKKGMTTRLSTRIGPFSGDIRIQRSKYSLEALFENNNSRVISVVAESLKSSPGEVHRFTVNDILHFLATPGSAPKAILKALFLKRSHIRYWRLPKHSQNEKVLAFSQSFIFAHDNVAKRMWAQAAMVRLITVYGRNQYVINFTDGPSLAEVDQHLKTPNHLKDEMPAFVDRLAPQPDTVSPLLGKKLAWIEWLIGNLFEEKVFMPVDFHVCLIPDFHKKAQVLVAIACCPNQEIFAMRECEAIVSHSWYQVTWLHTFDLCLQAVTSTILLAMVATLRSKDNTIHSRLEIVAHCGLLPVCISFILILAQVVGHIAITKSFYTVLTRDALEVFRIAFAFVMFLALAILRNDEVGSYDRNIVDSAVFRSFLLVLVFLSWLRFIFKLRLATPDLSMIIQPIFTAMARSSQFNFAVLCLALVLWECWWCLNIESWSNPITGMTAIFRFAFLSDSSIDELEGIDGDGTWNSQPDSTALTWQDPPSSENYLIVRILLVCCGIMFPVLIMNILVSVLGVWLEFALKNVWLHFQQARALMVLDYMAMLHGLRWRRQSSFYDDGSLDNKDSGSGGPKVDRFLWFAAPRDDEMRGDDETQKNMQDSEDNTARLEKLQVIVSELNQNFKAMNGISEKRTSQATSLLDQQPFARPE